MHRFDIQPVEKHNLDLLDTALRALSEELGDQHPVSIELLEQAAFAPTPAFYALLALDTKNVLSGAVAFSPVLSTTLAATGLYVSDLWVAQSARGHGLGKHLLAHAADVSQARWGAKFLKLSVYDDAHRARQFYDRLGLKARQGETTLILDTTGVNALKAAEQCE